MKKLTGLFKGSVCRKHLNSSQSLLVKKAWLLKSEEVNGNKLVVDECIKAAFCDFKL